MLIDRELWARWKIEAGDLIEEPDFLPGFRNELVKSTSSTTGCNSPWDIFNGDEISEIGGEEWRWGKRLVVQPGYIKGNYTFTLDKEVAASFCLLKAFVVLY